MVSGAGGGGIGTTITAMAAQAGATVIAVSRSQENLREHITPLAERGLAVIPVAADASTDEGVATVLEAAQGANGQLYGLVNVAGGAEPATWMPSTRVARADWRKIFTLHDSVIVVQGRTSFGPSTTSACTAAADSWKSPLGRRTLACARKSFVCAGALRAGRHRHLHGGNVRRTPLRAMS